MANIANPYRGLIDPDDADGKKMIFKMTKGLDESDKFNLTSKNIGDFRDEVEEAAHTFCFGSVLFNIPISYDVDGDVLDTRNLVTEPNAVSKEDVQDFASRVWGNVDGDHIIDSSGDLEQDPVLLQQRIRSSLFGQWIKNSLTKEAKKKLLLKKALFRHTYNDDTGYEDDGTTMLRVIFDKCDPTTKSGINNLKARLSDFKLADHKQDVPEMLDEMLVTFNKIVMAGGQDDDFMLKVFNALSTSDNEDFLDFIKKKRDAWEEDQLDDDVDVLIDACIKKHNNITSKRSAKSSSSPSQHVNESESKFMALLTNLLPAVLAATAQQRPTTPSNGQPHQNHKLQPSYLSHLDPARFVYVGPTMTDTNGKLWHWCTQHKDNKGTYVSHPPERHEEYAERNKKFRSGRNPRTQSQQPPSGRSTTS